MKDKYSLSNCIHLRRKNMHECRKGRTKIHAFVSKPLHDFFWKIEFWASSHTACRLNQFNWRRKMHNYLKRWVEWTLKFTWGCSFAISFFFADLVESLFANLKELHSGKKHLELILSLCIRGNDRSVEGKL